MTTTSVPRWDLTPIFGGLDDRAFNAALEGVYARVDRLVALYDELDIRDTEPRAVSDADVAALESVLAATNELQSELRPVNTYLYALITTDSRDDLAASRHVELQTRGAPLAALAKRLGSWLAALGVDELIARSPAASEHAFAVGKAAEGAELQMGEQEESLAGELAPSGSLAWQRLHGEVSSQLMVDVRDSSGGSERVPMAFARGLATHPDAARRRAAYEGELEAWETMAVPLAAALNGAKGELGVLNRRRGFVDDLEPALRTNNVDRATLDAMTGAVVASLPDFRRYLRAKAKLLGHNGGLPWWDLFAPIGSADGIPWTSATDQVRAAFAGYSPDLEGLANRAFREQWIDAETRAGKQGGAYCAGVAGDVSRVMMNFDGSQDSVSTLAHELGHAFHNVVLAPRTPIQRRLPMALAETASIFCETLLFEHTAAAASDDGERLALLDVHLVGATQTVVDIHSRFRFETELCARRRRTSLSVADMKAAMLDAQEAAYGDGLDADYRHEYMWAVKGHYFTPFYNWPYTFGLLFGIGLYARYLDDPDAFRAGYDDLLSTVGMADAASLAGRFGFDVRDGGFWAESLAVLRRHIDDYVQLATPVARMSRLVVAGLVTGLLVAACASAPAATPGRSAPTTTAGNPRATFPRPPPVPSTIAPVAYFRPLATARPLRILVVGDSVGVSFAKGLARWGRQSARAVVLDDARPFCALGRYLPRDVYGPQNGSAGCDNWGVRWANDVRTFDPDVVFVMFTIWEVAPRKLPGATAYAQPGNPALDAWQLSEYQDAADVLSARGAPVVWFSVACENGARIKRGDPLWYVNRRTIPALARSRAMVRLIDLDGFLCNGTHLVNNLGGVKNIRPDGAHYSVMGAQALAGWVMPIVLGTKPAPPYARN